MANPLFEAAQGTNTIFTPRAIANLAARTARPGTQPQPNTVEDPYQAPEAQEAQEQPQQPEQPGLGARIGGAALNTVAAVGNLLDLPGSSVRDALTGRNPLDQWLDPFGRQAETNRISGRDMLREKGLVGKEDNWKNFIGGMALEIATDPTTYMGVGALSRAGKAFSSIGVNAKKLRPLAKEMAETGSKNMGPKASTWIGGKLASFSATPKMIFDHAENILEKNVKPLIDNSVEGTFKAAEGGSAFGSKADLEKVVVPPEKAAWAMVDTGRRIEIYKNAKESTEWVLDAEATRVANQRLSSTVLGATPRQLKNQWITAHKTNYGKNLSPEAYAKLMDEDMEKPLRSLVSVGMPFAHPMKEWNATNNPEQTWTEWLKKQPDLKQSNDLPGGPPPLDASTAAVGPNAPKPSPKAAPVKDAAKEAAMAAAQEEAAQRSKIPPQQGRDLLKQLGRTDLDAIADEDIAKEISRYGLIKPNGELHTSTIGENATRTLHQAARVFGPNAVAAFPVIEKIAKTWAKLNGVENADEYFTSLNVKLGDVPDGKLGKYVGDPSEIVTQDGVQKIMRMGERVITAMKGADGQAPSVATFMHEIGHDARAMFDSTMQKKMEDAVGAVIRDRGLNVRLLDENGRWTYEAEEIFANGFEAYLTGAPPLKGLAKVFETLKGFIQDLWSTISGNPKLEDFVHPDLKKVFDEILSPKKAKGPKAAAPPATAVSQAADAVDGGADEAAGTKPLQPDQGGGTGEAADAMGEAPAGTGEALDATAQSLSEAADTDHKNIGRGSAVDDALTYHGSSGMKTDDSPYDIVDAAVGSQFNSHGLSKGSPAEQARQLDNLLSNGVDDSRDFYTAPFEVDSSNRAAMAAAMGTSGGTAYKNGVAVVTGGYGVSIKDGGIVNVFINDAMPQLKAAVEAKYGDRYNVHFLSEQKAVLESQASKNTPKPDAAPAQTAATATQTANTPKYPGVTPEAAAMLEKLDQGSGAPSQFTRNLEKIAAENGIEITGSMTPKNVIEKLREKATQRVDDVSPNTAPEQVAPETGKPFSATAYRGVKSGKTANDGSSGFWSPDKKVADAYAGKDGNVTEETIAFQNPLVADNWTAAKKDLGLPKSTTMPELERHVAGLGHDGIVFKSHNGKPEYVKLSPSTAPEQAVDAFRTSPAESLTTKPNVSDAPTGQADRSGQAFEPEFLPDSLSPKERVEAFKRIADELGVKPSDLKQERVQGGFMVGPKQAPKPQQNPLVQQAAQAPQPKAAMNNPIQEAAIGSPKQTREELIAKRDQLQSEADSELSIERTFDLQDQIADINKQIEQMPAQAPQPSAAMNNPIQEAAKEPTPDFGNMTIDEYHAIEDPEIKRAAYNALKKEGGVWFNGMQVDPLRHKEEIARSLDGNHAARTAAVERAKELESQNIPLEKAVRELIGSDAGQRRSYAELIDELNNRVVDNQTSELARAIGWKPSDTAVAKAPEVPMSREISTSPDEIAKIDPQTETPEFKGWFGDWKNDPANASKVVDAEGRPLKVFHGTGNADLGVQNARAENNALAQSRIDRNKWEKEWGDKKSSLQEEKYKLQKETQASLQEEAERILGKKWLAEDAADIAWYSDNIEWSWMKLPAPRRDQISIDLIKSLRDKAVVAKDKIAAIEKELSAIPSKPKQPLYQQYQGESDAFNTLAYGANDTGYLSAGTYFSKDGGLAGEYAKFGMGDKEGVIPVYLNIRNPYIHGVTDDKRVGDLVNKYLASLDQRTRNHRGDVDDYSRNQALARRQALEELGYDGEIYDRDVAIAGGAEIKSIANSEIVAFYPEQIKSATANSGEFNPRSGSITDAPQMGLFGQRYRAGRDPIAPDNPLIAAIKQPASSPGQMDLEFNPIEAAVPKAEERVAAPMPNMLYDTAKQPGPKPLPPRVGGLMARAKSVDKEAVKQSAFVPSDELINEAKGIGNQSPAPKAGVQFTPAKDDVLPHVADAESVLGLGENGKRLSDLDSLPAEKKQVFDELLSDLNGFGEGEREAAMEEVAKGLSKAIGREATPDEVQKIANWLDKTSDQFKRTMQRVDKEYVYTPDKLSAKTKGDIGEKLRTLSKKGMGESLTPDEIQPLVEHLGMTPAVFAEGADISEGGIKSAVKEATGVDLTDRQAKAASIFMNSDQGSAAKLREAAAKQQKAESVLDKDVGGAPRKIREPYVGGQALEEMPLNESVGTITQAELAKAMAGASDEEIQAIAQKLSADSGVAVEAKGEAAFDPNMTAAKIKERAQEEVKELRKQLRKTTSKSEKRALENQIEEIKEAAKQGKKAAQDGDVQNMYRRMNALKMLATKAKDAATKDAYTKLAMQVRSDIAKEELGRAYRAADGLSKGVEAFRIENQSAINEGMLNLIDRHDYTKLPRIQSKSFWNTIKNEIRPSAVDDMTKRVGDIKDAEKATNFEANIISKKATEPTAGQILEVLNDDTVREKMSPFQQEIMDQARRGASPIEAAEALQMSEEKYTSSLKEVMDKVTEIAQKRIVQFKDATPAEAAKNVITHKIAQAKWSEIIDLVKGSTPRQTLLQALDVGDNLFMANPATRMMLRLFDAEVMGAGTLEEQEIARLAYKAQERGVFAFREIMHPIVHYAGRQGFFDRKAIATKLIKEQKMERVAALKETDRLINERNNELVRFFEEKGSAKLDHTKFGISEQEAQEFGVWLESVKKLLPEDLLNKRAAGLAWMALDDIKAYSPRRSVTPGTSVLRNEKNKALLDASVDSQISREPHLKNLPGGTPILNAMSLDEAISGIGHDEVVLGTGLSKATLDRAVGHILKNYKDELLTDDLMKNGVPTEEGMEKIRKIASSIAELPKDHVEQQIPWFGNNFLRDLSMYFEQSYMRQSVSLAAQRLAVKNMITTSDQKYLLSTFFEQAKMDNHNAYLNVIKQTGRFGDYQRFAQDRFNEWLKNGDITVDDAGMLIKKGEKKAMSPADMAEQMMIAKMYAKDKGMGVSKETHEAAGYWLQAFSRPQEITVLKQMAATALNAFKSMVTVPFAAFHGRNKTSGFMQNVFFGAYDPTANFADRYFKTERQAFALRTGKPIKNIHKELPEDIVNEILEEAKRAIPDNINDLTDAQKDAAVTEWVRAQVFKYGLVGDRQGHSAEKIIDTTSSLTSQSPGTIAKDKGNWFGLKNPLLDPTTSLREKVNFTAYDGAPYLALDKTGARPKVDVKKYEETTFTLGAVGQELGSMVEDTNRVSPFLAFLKQGITPEEAARRVHAIQFDYSKSTDFEKVLKQFIPFYMFASRSLKLTVTDLLENPGGKQAWSIRAANRSQDTERPIPEHVRRGIAIPLGKGAEGQDRYLSGFGLAWEDPLEMLSFIHGDGKATAASVFSKMRPELQAIPEAASGRSMFFDKNFSDLDPQVGRMRDNLLMRETKGLADPIFGSQSLEFLIGKSPVARVPSTINNILDSRKSPFEKLLGATTGIKVTDVNAESAARMEIDQYTEQLKELGGREMKLTTLPEWRKERMTPEELKQAEELQKMIRSIQSELRERKKQAQVQSLRSAAEGGGVG